MVQPLVFTRNVRKYHVKLMVLSPPNTGKFDTNGKNVPSWHRREEHNNITSGAFLVSFVVWREINLTLIQCDVVH